MAKGNWAEELKSLVAELQALAEGGGDVASGGESPGAEFRKKAEGLLGKVNALLGEIAGADAPRDGAGTPPAGTRPKLLVVDDDGVSRSILASFLGRYGEVFTAQNGPEAVTQTTKAVRSGQHFKLIFLDFHMPEMDGHETIRRIKALEEVYSAKRPAIIAMTTAVGDRGTVLKARQAGSEGYFVKPLDFDKLGDWVESHGLEKS